MTEQPYITEIDRTNEIDQVNTKEHLDETHISKCVITWDVTNEARSWGIKSMYFDVKKIGIEYYETIYVEGDEDKTTCYEIEITQDSEIARIVTGYGPSRKVVNDTGWEIELDINIRGDQIYPTHIEIDWRRKVATVQFGDEN